MTTVRFRRWPLAGVLVAIALAVACQSDGDGGFSPWLEQRKLVVHATADPALVDRVRIRLSSGDSQFVDTEFALTEGNGLGAVIPPFEGSWRFDVTAFGSGGGEIASASRSILVGAYTRPQWLTLGSDGALGLVILGTRVPVSKSSPRRITILDTVEIGADVLDGFGGGGELRTAWTIIRGSRTIQIDSARFIPGDTGTIIVETATDDALVRAYVRARPITFVGAGDIGACTGMRPPMFDTGDVLDTIPGTIFTAGDNAYPDGSIWDFVRCYDPAWGRHRHRTRPSLGNHDYHTRGAEGYFAYFDGTSGERGTGYYSYDLGSWHIVALNSNVDMTAGSPQEQWLRADLAAHPSLCTAAYFHHPLFSGTVVGWTLATRPLYNAMYAAGVDVIIAGHAHAYERMAPQTPMGVLDTVRGIRMFNVGTGGADFHAFAHVAPNTEVRQNTAWGVLRFSLYSTEYSWAFIRAAGSPFADSGRAVCH